MKADNKMKILTYDFRWVDAVFNTENGRIELTDGNRFRESQIIAIDNDVRKKYVICSNCGAIIRNTPKAIQAHKALADSSDACFHCHHMQERNSSVLKKSYTRQEDGTYMVMLKTQCTPMCTKGWSAHEINSDEARTGCMYQRCKMASPVGFSDIFTKYPGAFEDMATVDAIDTSKWTLIGSSGDFYIFKASSRFNLRVYVHNTGIISQFSYTSRYTRNDFRYSKKYRKLIWIDGYDYTESSSVTQNVQTQLLKLVEAIYNKES